MSQPLVPAIDAPQPIVLTGNFGPDPLIARVRDHFQAFPVQFVQFVSKSAFFISFDPILTDDQRAALEKAAHPIVVASPVWFRNQPNIYRMHVPIKWVKMDTDAVLATGVIEIGDDEDEEPGVPIPPRPSTHEALAGEEPPMPTFVDSPTEPLPAEYRPVAPPPPADEAAELRASNEALRDVIRQLLTPAPARIEVFTLTQDIDDTRADDDLAAKLTEGWHIEHITVNTFVDYYSTQHRSRFPRERHIRIITLTREAALQPVDPTPHAAHAAVEQPEAVSPDLPFEPLPVEQPEPEGALVLASAASLPAILAGGRFPIAADLHRRGADAVLADMNRDAMAYAARAVAAYRAAFPPRPHTAIPGRV